MSDKADDVMYDGEISVRLVAEAKAMTTPNTYGEFAFPDARAVELARRLVAAGPKACAVSVSECHEITEAVLAAYAPGAFPEQARKILTAMADQLEEAERQISRLSKVVTRAIEVAVDTALGEVARQQGGIAGNIGVEARGSGVSAALGLVTGAAALEVRQGTIDEFGEDSPVKAFPDLGSLSRPCPVCYEAALDAPGHCPRCGEIRLFEVRQPRSIRATYSREVWARSAEEALRIVEKGTAWPESYDESQQSVERGAYAVKDVTATGVMRMDGGFDDPPASTS